MNQLISSWDSGLSGAYSFFKNNKYSYCENMPIIKVITQTKLEQFDLDSKGKKQFIKSGPNKGKAKMKLRRPEKTKKELDVKDIMVQMNESSVIIIERQNPRPGNSAGSSFTTGINYGKLIACAELSNAEIIIVQPNVWKKALKLSDNKEASVLMAESLTGKTFRTSRGRLLHDMAESMLIGHYYLTHIKGKK